MVTFVAVYTSCRAILTCPQECICTLRQLAAADTVDFWVPAVLLNILEGLTIEAPQRFRGESPNGAYTPRTEIEEVWERAPKCPLNLACRLPSAVTSTVSAPFGKGDRLVIHDGIIMLNSSSLTGQERRNKDYSS